MSNQVNNHQFDDSFTKRKELWEEDDFLKDIDRRIKETEAGNVIGSTWEEIKAKSKT